MLPRIDTHTHNQPIAARAFDVSGLIHGARAYFCFSNFTRIEQHFCLPLSLSHTHFTMHDKLALGRTKPVSPRRKKGELHVAIFFAVCSPFSHNQTVTLGVLKAGYGSVSSTMANWPSRSNKREKRYLLRQMKTCENRGKFLLRRIIQKVGLGLIDF